MHDGLKTDKMTVGSITADYTSAGTGEIGVTELGSAIINSANIATGGVGATNIASNAVTANKQYFVGLGSPPAGGYNLQGGRGVLATGSRWVAFGKKYVASPYVVASPLEAAVSADVNTTWVGATSIMAGSFLAVGSGTATGSFTWFAVGSGTW